MSEVCGSSFVNRGQVIKPDVTPDKTLASTVFGLVHDVIPQTSTNTGSIEKIDWVCFEVCDLNDPAGSDLLREINGKESPLILVLGLKTGYQIWALMSNGECEELLSVREGPVKALKFLPSASALDATHNCDTDVHIDKRPLIAVCDSSSAGRQFCTVSIVSLRSGDTIHTLRHSEPINTIAVNRRVLVVSLPRRLVIYCAQSFAEKFRIEGCPLVKDSFDVNPFALGDSWLAYADDKLNTALQSCGGVCNLDVQSYASAMLSAAKSFGKNIGQVVSQLGKSSPQVKSVKAGSQSEASASPKASIVTIININAFSEKQTSIHGTKMPDGVVAHFPAHLDNDIATLAFNSSGQLLFSADTAGHAFHVFAILPHPGHCALGAVHHLYTLNRGSTVAQVQNVAFAMDSRWCAVTTFHGTTHIYPITPYGGPVNMRTHTSAKVVNRHSRFHRSAGLENLDPKSAAIARSPPSPPHLSGSPSGSPVTKDVHPSLSSVNLVSSRGAMNPRLPPYPLPVLLSAAFQLKQVFSLPNLASAGAEVVGSIGGGLKKDSSAGGERNRQAAAQAEGIMLAVCFAQARGFGALNPGLKREQDFMDSIFVVNCQGELMEYLMTVKPMQLPASAKFSADTSIELRVASSAQWLLQRSRTNADLRPPLSSKHPLLAALAIVRKAKEKRAKEQQSNNKHGINLALWDEELDSLSGKKRTSSGGSDKKKSPVLPWISQVEIVSYAGPHRRLWTGPQFTFKTYMDPNTSAELITPSGLVSAASSNNNRLGRSDPVAMPTARVPLHSLPVVIEAHSGSFEQQPSLALEVCGSWSDSDYLGYDDQQDFLRQHLAEAMLERPATGGDSVSISSSSSCAGPNMACDVDVDDLTFPTLTDESQSVPSRRGLEHLRQDSSELLFLEARESQ